MPFFLPFISSFDHFDQIKDSHENGLDQTKDNRENSHMLKKRYLYDKLKSLALDRNKMAFVSGPRQVGKTTFAQSLQSEFDEFQYKNWDESSFRKIWTRDPNQILNEFQLKKLNSTRLLILDEIHKSKNWKQRVKGLYDTNKEKIIMVVTGSARLNVFKKGGDSMMGRYLNFRLHPLSYGELCGSEFLAPEVWKRNLFAKKPSSEKSEILSQLLKYSGFPEPYFSDSISILNIWRKSRNEKIIREDLRDLSRLPELSQVEMLASLLPEKVGSPLSVQSIREDLEVSHDTTKRWLNYLAELYYFFEIKPWAKSIPRSIKKEGKIYLYDWTELSSDGLKFENLVACQLLKACHFWTDTGEGDYSLHFLRNKEKQELDFLIVKDKRPWLSFECKLADPNMDKKIVNKFQQFTKCPHVHLVFSSGYWYKEDEHKLICSSSFAFKGLP